MGWGWKGWNEVEFQHQLPTHHLVTSLRARHGALQLLLTRPLPQARLRGLRARYLFIERPVLIGGDTRYLIHI